MTDHTPPAEPDRSKWQCILLLFLPTSDEERALKDAASRRNLAFEKIRHPGSSDYHHWLGVVGNETVIAIPPARERGRVVMGALGRLGSAAKAIHFR